MKTFSNSILMASALVASLAFTSCSDFLDREPLSDGTEAITFHNAEQFQQAADALYGPLPQWKNCTGFMDQNLDISGLASSGGTSVPETDGSWNFGDIRTCCILIEKAEEYTTDIDNSDIAASVGTAHFFRAYHHFALLRRYGGVPIIDHRMDLDDEVMYGPRNSRYEVVNFIISDLTRAINLLPEDKNLTDAERGRVGKDAAKALLARVLLYEGTWEKYVPAIGLDLDGDGVSSGAGKQKPEGYYSIDKMFSEAKRLSAEVIDEAESNGTYSLWNECDSLSYYYLFNIDDKGGNICNFKGAGKKTNREFILFTKYDYDLRRGGTNLTHRIIVWGGTNISASFGESFLCRNGLPIRISYTGNMADAQNNPEFMGYGEFASEFRNRDYRFVGCAYLPDRSTWSSRDLDNRKCTVFGQPYPTPAFPERSDDPTFPGNGDTYDQVKDEPAYSSPSLITRPVLRGGNFGTYGSRKYLSEGANRPDNTESSDIPVIRLAELYLIYAEASCELGNGEISDQDLDYSINKTRRRAGVAPLTNALIANVWDAGYFDHATGHTICKKMTMLDEIRRERTCELFGEGFRLDDLKRWGIAHINLTGQKLGRHVLNTAYTKYRSNDATYYGQPCYFPEAYPLVYGVYEGSGESDPDYGRSIATSSDNLFFQVRDYLSPLPLEQIRLNPQLKQNPGW